MAYSVKIDGKDIHRDLGALMTNYTISPPKPQENLLQIPLRNGSLDLTEALTDEVKYENRDINIKLQYLGYSFLNVYSNIMNYCHGKKCQVIFDDDLDFYYEGRLEVSDFKYIKYGATFEINGSMQPFKTSVFSSDEPWLWDPFDFETGIINEFQDIVVNGSETITLLYQGQRTYISITTDSQITVSYKGESVVVGAGTTTLYEFNFDEGENEIVLSGNATVSIKYREVSL